MYLDEPAVAINQDLGVDSKCWPELDLINVRSECQNLLRSDKTQI